MKVEKTGRILYDVSISCPCRIVRTAERPAYLRGATGDDTTTYWFRVDFTAAGNPTHWSSSVEAFSTIEEAIGYLVGMGVEWDEPT